MIGVWQIIKDGDPRALYIFNRHYSRRIYADGRRPSLFVGPGQKLVLMTSLCDAIFAWRKFKSDNNQSGVNCAVFRNEGPARASDLILAAETIAWQRWPGERLYTYVDPRKVKTKGKPGWCFIKAGWRQCGVTKVNKLLIFEKYPNARTE